MRAQSIVIFTLVCIGVSCADHDKTIKTPGGISNNTIIKKQIVDESGGKIRHAIYFTIRDNDTLNLRYDFSLTSQNELKVTVYEHDISRGPLVSYREELLEQKLVFQEAAKDFELKSLKKIWDLSLLITGDLAIAITRQLPPELLNRQLNNLDAERVLLTSKLTEDLNELLKPYGKKIKNYIVEKTHLLDSSVIFKYNKIETPRSEIPSKILDAQIWTVIESIGG